MLPKYSTFQLEIDKGGLAAPVLKDILDSRLTSIWVKLLYSNSFWAKVKRSHISQQLHDKKNTSIVHALTRPPIRLKGWPDF